MKKKFLRLISPKRAVDDFVGHWKQPTPHRWQILGVAGALTFAMFMLLVPESQRVPPARPEVTYITTWDETRTRDEIIASNLANQERQDRIAALMQERAELRKELYRQLGRATFVDVDAMEKEIEADKAAEESASQQQQPAQSSSAQ